MENAARNVFLLACCQALLFTNNVTLISLNGLAGFALADNKALATLPVTGYVVGAALSTFPASMWMKRVGSSEASVCSPSSRRARDGSSWASRP